jgi:hypothetical protein
MKEIQKILATNKENIEKTLTEVPSIAQNIDSITSEVSHNVKTVRGAIDSISEKGEAAATSLGSGDFITNIMSLFQVVMFVKNLFGKSIIKKRRVK